MQMVDDATPGCSAALVRRFVMIMHLFVGGCVGVVVCLLAFVVCISFSCTIFAPYCLWISCTPNASVRDSFKESLQGTALLLGAFPALACAITSVLFGIALNIALLPLTLLGVLWSIFCGDIAADRLETHERQVNPRSRCQMAFFMIFMPFIVYLKFIKSAMD